jgi:hypothetical protein
VNLCCGVAVPGAQRASATLQLDNLGITGDSPLASPSGAGLVGHTPHPKPRGGVKFAGGDDDRCIIITYGMAWL